MTRPHRNSAIPMDQSVLPGNRIVSRTVYAGSASTATVGQALPGGGVATNDGSVPNVFKNEASDAPLGVTSPIFLDQLTQSDLHGSSIAIDASLVTTSSASKSELALNVPSDGKSVSYGATSSIPRGVIFAYRASLTLLMIAKNSHSRSSNRLGAEPWIQ